jgi:hypothetical protein
MFGEENNHEGTRRVREFQRVFKDTILNPSTALILDAANSVVRV